MGTQVLAAQDHLVHSNSDVFYGRRKRTTNPGVRKSNNNSHRKSNVVQNLEKRTSSINRSPSAPALTAKHHNKKQRLPGTNFKRGESLNIGNPAGIKISPTNSDDSYAGSACFLSPSPRSLPLPSFFSKNSVTTDQNCDETATKDLRRLLRIE